MRRTTVGWVAAITLLFTTAWLVLLIVDQARAGPLATYAQALAHVQRLDAVYYAIYLCAGLLTATTAMLMAGLHELYRDAAPVGARMSMVFVPIYATLNLAVYFSQITIVPALLAEHATSPAPWIDAALHQMLHLAPSSAAAYANALAYAALAIPLILFGFLLWREAIPGDVWPRATGALLVLSGALSLAGFAGMVVEVPLIDQGLVAGGVAFWLGLFPFSYLLLRTNAMERLRR